MKRLGMAFRCLRPIPLSIGTHSQQLPADRAASAVQQTANRTDARPMLVTKTNRDQFIQMQLLMMAPRCNLTQFKGGSCDRSWEPPSITIFPINWVMETAREAMLDRYENKPQTPGGQGIEASRPEAEPPGSPSAPASHTASDTAAS